METIKKKNYPENYKRFETIIKGRGITVKGLVSAIKTYDESSFESMRAHIIKKPYKIFQPIKDKMKAIRNDRELSLLIYSFRNIKKSEIEKINLPNVKVRSLNPLVKGIRIK